MTMAAVLAMFASTQVAATTLAVRQHGAATSPVRGSTMWCTVRPPRRHRRRKVPEVARPPAVRVTVRVGFGSSWSSDTPICQPSRAAPRRSRVTAEAHEHAATCEVGRPRRDAVGGQRLGRGAQVQPDAARRTQRPLLGVPSSRRQPGAGPAGATGWSIVADLGEVAVVAQRANGRRRSSGRRRRWSAPPPGAQRTPPRRAAPPPGRWPRVRRSRGRSRSRGGSGCTPRRSRPTPRSGPHPRQADPSGRS